MVVFRERMNRRQIPATPETLATFCRDFMKLRYARQKRQQWVIAWNAYMEDASYDGSIKGKQHGSIFVTTYVCKYGVSQADELLWLSVHGTVFRKLCFRNIF